MTRVGIELPNNGMQPTRKKPRAADAERSTHKGGDELEML